MVARIQSIALGLFHNPVVYRSHSSSRQAWIFAPSTFKSSPWLTLHRQSLRDNELDQFLVDRSSYSHDDIEIFLAKLYSQMGLGEEREPSMRDDADPIRDAVRIGQIKDYKYPIAATDNPNIFSPGHIAWSNKARYLQNNIDSLDYSRYKIAFHLGEALKPRWQNYRIKNELYYDQNLLMRGLISTGAFFSGVIDGAESLAKALWELGKLTVTVVEGAVTAVAKFATDPPSLGEVIEGCKQLGITIKKGYEELKALLEKATTIFNEILKDPGICYAVVSYIDGLAESMPHTDKLELFGKIVFEVGLEVILFLISGGIANVARRAGQAAVKTAKMASVAAKGQFIGPFPVKMLEEVIEFSHKKQKLNKIKADRDAEMKAQKEVEQ